MSTRRRLLQLPRPASSRSVGSRNSNHFRTVDDVAASTAWESAFQSPTTTQHLGSGCLCALGRVCPLSAPRWCRDETVGMAVTFAMRRTHRPRPSSYRQAVWATQPTARAGGPHPRVARRTIIPAGARGGVMASRGAGFRAPPTGNESGSIISSTSRAGGIENVGIGSDATGGSRSQDRAPIALNTRRRARTPMAEV